AKKYLFATTNENYHDNFLYVTAMNFDASDFLQNDTEEEELMDTDEENLEEEEDDPFEVSTTNPWEYDDRDDF
ncbi:MAG: hypothetical protein WDZ74_00205, partial [Candidatus Paceibacterota bacterium]